MEFTRHSPLSGKYNTIDVPCTQAQYDAWVNGALIQNAMPDVPAELREFLITGITPAEWDLAFGDSD